MNSNQKSYGTEVINKLSNTQFEAKKGKLLDRYNEIMENNGLGFKLFREGKDGD